MKISYADRVLNGARWLRTRNSNLKSSIWNLKFSLGDPLHHRPLHSHSRRIDRGPARPLHRDPGRYPFFPHVAPPASLQPRITGEDPARGWNPIRLDEGTGRTAQDHSRRLTQHRLAQLPASATMPTTCSPRNSSAPRPRLIRLAEQSPTAYMCAERVYFHCHRMLVSDWLTAHGHEVLHIDGTGPVKAPQAARRSARD